MNRAVHTLLLGDQTAAAKRLPFARTKLQAMFAELGPGRRHVVRHFTIEGDSIDLWVDALGGRIQITAAVAVGELRAFVVDFGVSIDVGNHRWELFKAADLTEVISGRIALVENFEYFPAFEFVEGVGSFFVAVEDGIGKLRHRNMAGAAVWTQSLPTVLALANVSSAFVGSSLIYATDELVESPNPAADSRQRYALYRVNPADGAAVSEVELFAYDVMPPVTPGDPALNGLTMRNIAGASSLFSDFHLFGLRLIAGPPGGFVPAPTNFELHLMDGATLSSVSSITLEAAGADPRPRRVLTDDTGIVYLLYMAPSSFEIQSLRAYSRDLTRRADLDFAFPAPIEFSPIENVAVIGDFCYVHQRDTKNLLKVNRAGDIAKTFVYDESVVETFSSGVLIPIRKQPTS